MDNPAIKFSYRARKIDEDLIARAEEDGHNKSIYPSWHPQHICGMFCDGQDGMSSRCAQEKQVGPPSWWRARCAGRFGRLSMLEILEKHNFTNLDVVHEGDWGKVYRAQPLQMYKKYAVKIAQGEASTKRLHLERDVLEKIGEHENITTLFFTGQDSDYYFIVEEFVPYTLRKVMDDWHENQRTAYDKSKPHFETQLDIIKQVLQALSYAHSKSVVHQDLKPENILLVKDHNAIKNQVRLCDFGFAREIAADELVSSLEDTRAVAGSLDYLSPEQRAGKHIDKRTDLYNVGLIFYEMLTGKKPTINMLKPTEVRQRYRDKITNIHMTKPEALPKWVDDFILKALAAERGERFSSAKEMLAAIESSTVPQPEPEPQHEPSLGVGARIKGIFSVASKAVIKTSYAILMLPFWVVFAPLFFIYWAMGSKWVERNDLEFLCVVVFLAWFCGWYFVATPYGFQKNLEYQMTQNIPGGTLVYYREFDDSKHPQGFYFTDGRQLPAVHSFCVETPEISGARTPGGYAFFPKHALDQNGKFFYYTTPTGLIKIRLDLPKANPDFRTVVVKSEVFNYFTTLAFVKDGPRGDGLYAKLKNETWFVTPEGLLEQTEAISFENYNKRSFNGYYLDGNEVEFNSDLIGNFNIGPEAGGHAGYWYDFPIAAFRSQTSVEIEDGN